MRAAWPTIGDVPVLEHYRGHGERRHTDGRVDTAQPASRTVAEARAEARLAAHTLTHRFAEGRSAVRALHEGAHFALTEHSLYGLDAQASGANRFVVLRVTHEAANNLGTQAAQILLATDIEQGSYRNQFQAVPATTRLVPTPIERPTAPGMQTATVVAAEGEPLDHRPRRPHPHPVWLAAWHCALARRFGRARQPHRRGHRPCARERAQRHLGACGAKRGRPQLGCGLHAPRGHRGAGGLCGRRHRPPHRGRPGLHNGQHDLPWPAGVDASANHPGTVSGWHSQHLDGQGANQWLIDDATGQLRMRLASHSAATGWNELSLGHLIQHSGHGGEGHARRGHVAGIGLLRRHRRLGRGARCPRPAADHQQPCAQGASVASTQMDAAEAVAQLKAARQLGEALSQSARQQGAQGLTATTVPRPGNTTPRQMDPQPCKAATRAAWADSKPRRPRAAPSPTRSSALPNPCCTSTRR
jgi:type VI secretion system secreted protein VgrG